MTSFVINAPSHLVIIQSTGKDLTNLQKFIGRAAVSFLFRCSLPLFRRDPSIFELSIKSIPAELQQFLKLVLTSLILSLKSSSSRFIILENAVFTELSLSSSFTELTNFFAFFTMFQSFCKSLVPVWITTMSGFLRKV